MDATRILRYDENAPARDETATATFALGCFWGPDARFGAVDGVVRTRVGYAGGSTSQPSYHDVGDHSEAVQVEYDPTSVSFDELVAAAIDQHSPRRQSARRQYQNVLFYETTGERETIERRLESLAADDVETRVEPLQSFTIAETYHQKYNLRGERALGNRFDEAGYGDADVRESPAAAKLNADAAGHDVPEVSTVQ